MRSHAARVAMQAAPEVRGVDGRTLHARRELRGRVLILPSAPTFARHYLRQDSRGRHSPKPRQPSRSTSVAFGAWEGNWLAYNFGHDIALPGTRGPKLAFLMYPQAETAEARLDCLDPDTLRYTIRASEVTA
jgi:hypothetical protein